MDDEAEDQQTEGDEPDAPSTADAEGSEPEPEATSSGQFTQDQVNSIVQDRVQRERQQFEQQLKELGFEDLEDVRELKEKEKQRREQELKEKEKYKELLEQKEQEWQEELQEREQRLQKLEQERRREKVTTRLLTAAQEKGAVDPEQVAHLVRDQVDLDDDGNVVAVDNDGTPRLSDDGSPMSPETLVEEFLDDNDHFKQAASGRGAGGGPNDEPGGASNEEGFDPSKKHDPDHLLEHEEEIIEKAKKGEIEVL